MRISQAIADISGAVEATREELRKVSAAIDSLNQERHAVVHAPPHADDIVAVFVRGLSNEVESFKRQLGTHLGNTFVGDGSAEKVAIGRAEQLLRLNDAPPPRDFTERREGPAPLNLSVLAYLLRDRIEEEISGLVHDLCPASRDGMKAADRKQALAEIDAELAGLTEQKTALMADLEAARAAVLRQG